MDAMPQMKRRLVKCALWATSFVCVVNIVRHAIPAVIIIAVSLDPHTGLSSAIWDEFWEIVLYTSIILLSGVAIWRLRDRPISN